jgi:hypothetical protein
MRHLSDVAVDKPIARVATFCDVHIAGPISEVTVGSAR